MLLEDSNLSVELPTFPLKSNISETHSTSNDDIIKRLSVQIEIKDNHLLEITEKLEKT